MGRIGVIPHLLGDEKAWAFGGRAPGIGSWAVGVWQYWERQLVKG